MTVNGRTIGENCRGTPVTLPEIIRAFDHPLMERAGFLVLSGNLFDSAIMKTSVISADFRRRFLSDPADPDAFEGRAVVFDGPEDYHRRIEDPALAIGARDILVMRGAGPVGFPGAAEVVNMQPPAYLVRAGIRDLPCLGDGRQSGTSGSPSILNASPEAAAGGNLAILQTGDRLRIDLLKRRVDLLVDADEIAARRTRLDAAGGYPYPASQTPWQTIQRTLVGQLGAGAILEGSERFQSIAATGVPRDSH